MFLDCNFAYGQEVFVTDSQNTLTQSANHLFDLTLRLKYQLGDQNTVFLGMSYKYKTPSFDSKNVLPNNEQDYSLLVGYSAFFDLAQ